MAHLCLIDDFDELSNAFGGEAWPPSEVASIDGFAPGRDSGESHGCVVELDELCGILAIVDAVREEGRKLDGGGDLILVVVGGDDVVCIVRDEGDAPHVRTHVAPPSDDGFTIEGDFTTSHVKENLAPGVTEDRDGDKVVGDGGGFVSLSCCSGQLCDEELESVGGEHSCARRLNNCFGRQLCSGYCGGRC